MARRLARQAKILAAIVCGTLAAPPPVSTAAGRTAIAIIVNRENEVPDPSLSELRAMFTLERQFWPDGRRIVLLLPPNNSTPRAVLLRQVYAMSDFELRKYWVGQLFRGAIPSIPSILPSIEAMTAAVRDSKGSMSAVPASVVMPGVRVLRIDGKSPRDPGYPLTAPGP
jgi:hypothetical protein